MGCHLQGCTVGHGLFESVGWIAGERLQADPIQTAIPRMYVRCAKFLPEPEVRHGVQIPFDANAEAIIWTNHLVPTFGEPSQINDVALGAMLRHDAEVYCAATGRSELWPRGPARRYSSARGVDRNIVCDDLGCWR